MDSSHGERLMKNINRLIGLSFLVALGGSAQAATLTMNFDSLYTGFMPNGSAPWATVVFTDNGANTVDMVVTHNSTSASGQFVTKLLLNLDPIVGSVSGSAIAGKIATFNSVSVGSTNDAGTTFDFTVDFNQSNAGNGAQRLLPSDSVTIQLVGAGLSVANFDALSVGGTPVRALMHIQGIDGQNSGKVTEGVPEPASMIILGSAALAAFARKRRK